MTTPTKTKKMRRLGERNYSLVSRAVSTMGSYDPDKVLFLFEEELYADEVKPIVEFLRWVAADVANRAFGRSNYEARFREWSQQP